MQKEMENYLEVGTKIKLKQEMGFLNTIGKEYIISNVDKENKTVYFSVPFSDYSFQIFNNVSTVENQFNEMLICTASISFDELEKYFTISIEKTSKEWGYCDDNGNMITTKDRWSKWLYYDADFIYNSVFDDSATIVKCKYRISRDGRIQMKSFDFANQYIMLEFQSMLRRKEKTYFTSSYAICNKEYDRFDRTTGLILAKMRMRVKLAEMEANFVIQQLHEEN